MTSPQKVWLVTGTSTGIGKELCLAALKRGDKVIATARNVDKIDSTLREKGADVLQLDITDALENLKRIAENAIAIHGRVDVLVNNAGYISVGPIEEETPEATFRQYNTNVFGPLNVTRAFLPFMRPRRSGTIIFVGSQGGWTGMRGCGLYCGTKFAIRASAESLSHELGPLGLKVYCVEPGSFRTAVLSTGNREEFISNIPDYRHVMEGNQEQLLNDDGNQPGDPVKLSEVVVDLVRGEGVAKGRELPTVALPLGKDAWVLVNGVVGQMGKTLEEWKDVIESTDF
ncbi:hypothetical protein FRB94_011245 [Tulasnella sp. JGI-2019a]|nr:hypothetical protein FRB93_002422 [Tulasnella sp. JGI-2019a]KAG9009963.1 hypothetical protein FRB94_011245 [Tulasnella sp. JGI-2019a]KAG9030806.1 hypothetical protein FRB95_003498 [Tulasnella sp. JGI-2019a]